jgi:glycosyltransferase involved in cell wall biosynthesis
VAACCAAAARVPLVVTSHGVDLDPTGLLARKPLLRARYEHVLRRADALVAISRVIEERIHAVLPNVERLERIPNGVDAAQFATPVARPAELPPGIQSDRFFLFLGRLEERKGADLALDAFRQARLDGMGLVIAGMGNQWATLHERAAAAGLDGRAWFTGPVEGATKTWLLQNALCLLLPSRISEAFPLTLLESHAAGRPVIGSRVPGLEDLVEPGRTGWLAPTDDVSAWAETLTAVAADRPAADRAGLVARDAAGEYNWRRIAARHLALYEDLIAQRNARAA